MARKVPRLCKSPCFIHWCCCYLHSLLHYADQLEKDWDREWGDAYGCKKGERFCSSVFCKIFISEKFLKLFAFKSFLQKNPTLLALPFLIQGSQSFSKWAISPYLLRAMLSWARFQCRVLRHIIAAVHRVCWHPSFICIGLSHLICSWTRGLLKATKH